MTEVLMWFLDHGERLGVVAVLAAVIGGLSWVAKTLNTERKECNDSRLETNVSLGVMQGKIETLEGKLDTQAEGRAEHLADINKLHTKILEQVVKGIN